MRTVIPSLCLLSFLCFSGRAQVDTSVFNVLSLDGGGIRGLITAQVVEYLETETYKYANNTYCITQRDNEKISMAELFQMVSGTSTGSLLTAAIVLPSPTDPKKNKFWAADASNIYSQNGSQVFKTFEFPAWIRFVGTLFLAILGGFLGFYIGTKLYFNEQHEKAMKSAESVIRKKKTDENSNSTQMPLLPEGDNEQQNKDTIETKASLWKIFTKMWKSEDDEKIIEIKRELESGSPEDLAKAWKDLQKNDLKYRERKGRKWITMLIGIFLFAVLGWFLLPLIKKLTNSLYDRTGLEKVTTEQFGNAKIADVLTEDVMIVTYDFAGQKPVIFTKYAALKDPIMNQYIRDAAQASSAAPIYFDPKKIPGISDALIDGGVIANSPSFYSYLHAKYTLGKTKIRMVSIGTGEKQPEAITSESVNQVTWIGELGALITTVEQYTHEYLNKELLGDDYYYRFQKIMDQPLALDSYQSDNIQQLIQYGQDITTNSKNVPLFTRLISELVDQWAVGKYSKCIKEESPMPQTLFREESVTKEL